MRRPIAQQRSSRRVYRDAIMRELDVSYPSTGLRVTWLFDARPLRGHSRARAVAGPPALLRAGSRRGAREADPQLLLGPLLAAD